MAVIKRTGWLESVYYCLLSTELTTGKQVWRYLVDAGCDITLRTVQRCLRSLYASHFIKMERGGYRRWFSWRNMSSVVWCGLIAERKWVR